ncbi:MAG: autotransporter assembly complex family protein [Pseudomonadota bacterium]|nr:autotransporter assembly complex family protein [Pseudomonadota bacterium]
MPAHCRFSFSASDGKAFLRNLFVLFLFAGAGQAHALKLDVQVEGLEGEYEKNVLALLAIYQEREDENLSVPRLHALHRRAPEQIRNALAPFGLYQVQVSEELTPPPQEDGTWVARYKVIPGNPVKVGSVDYSITGAGHDDPAFPKSFPMKPGDVLLHADYEKAKEEIGFIAAQQGYLDAELVRHLVLLDMVAYEAIIEFHLDTGPRYFLGDVTFDQDLLDDELLDKFVTFEPGSVYDPEKLLSLQGKLLGTEYYEKVEIVPLKDEAGEDRVVPIEVVATPNKANKYRFGLGYSTDVGPRTILEWRRRYLTRWGHKFKLEASISQDIQSLKGDYRIPVGNPLRDYVTIRPEFISYDTASRKGDLFSLQFAHSVVTPGGWRRTAGVDYRYEDYEVIEDDRESVNELVPNISWAKTVTDNPIYTTKGYRLKFVLQGAVENIVSPASYLQGLASAKWIRAFADDYRFITRADLGATWADSVFDLPASRRFFTGGDNTIRGWAFEVLGPNDPVTNDTVGGRYLAVGSLELERRIKGDWSGAVFTDFGNAFDPDFKKEFEVGAGVGVRWRSPIGQVRMDVAFALTKDDPPNPRLVLVIGPDL